MGRNRVLNRKGKKGNPAGRRIEHARRVGHPGGRKRKTWSEMRGPTCDPPSLGMSGAARERNEIGKSGTVAIGRRDMEVTPGTGDRRAGIFGAFIASPLE